MDPFSCQNIINIIYIQLLLQTKSQVYTQIWYDSMEGNNNNGYWTAGGDVYFAYDSGGCFNALCTKTTAKSQNAYVVRNTNIAGYSSLQIKYDVSCYELEAGDTCNVYYGYDSISAKTLLDTVDPPDEDRTRHFYPDQIVTLPSSLSKSTVYIWLETDTYDGSGGDDCYWNNVYLMGAQTPPTLSPTQAPSSAMPTSSPTPIPTSIPTPSPTSTPTSIPTSSPTQLPTDIPTIGPTNAPTNGPTDGPTNNPTDTPTAHPEETVIGDDKEEEEPTVVVVTKDTNLVFVISLSNGIICCLGALLMFIIHKILKKKKRKRMSVVEDNIVDNEGNDRGPGYRKNSILSAMSSTVSHELPFGEHKKDDVAQDIAHHIEGEGEGKDDDIDDMYRNSLRPEKTVKTMETNDNNDDIEDMYRNSLRPQTTVESMGTDFTQTPMDIGVNIGKCRFCAQFKKGRIFDGDRQFYCDECWSYYVEEEAMGTDWTITGDRIGDTIGDITDYTAQ